MTIAMYTVGGMTCEHCVLSVTGEVNAIAGVTDAAVDLDSGSLTVTSNAPIDFAAIEAAIDEAGPYTVTAG